MRPPVRIGVITDPTHKSKHSVVFYSEDGSISVLASNLTRPEAARLVMPLRKAFLCGVQWMREDASSYLMSALPNIVCDYEDRP